MNVKVITRGRDSIVGETSKSVRPSPRNYEPDAHPLHVQREYVRALNAAKINKLLSKPFIGSLDGHKDVVSCMSKHPQKLSTLVTGAFDGEIRLWNLSTRRYERKFTAHESMITGLTFRPDGSYFLSSNSDNIKIWNTEGPAFGDDEEPSSTILTKTSVLGITHHQCKPVFATGGSMCYLWDAKGKDPLQTFKYDYSSLTVSDIKFNQIEDNLLITCGSDRSLMLFDIRTVKAVKKVTLRMPANCLTWNPRAAFKFTCGSNDYNAHTFDIRSFTRPLTTHSGHVNAIISIDYCPTGKEFVTGSYDRTVRIFEERKAYSREVYHTKRMQKLTSVLWSLDNKYIFTASDEMNIRIWKANAGEKLTPLNTREKLHLQYTDKLRKKYSVYPEVGKIERFRNVPRFIYTETERQKVQISKKHRKAWNQHVYTGKQLELKTGTEGVVLEQE